MLVIGSVLALLIGSPFAQAQPLAADAPPGVQLAQWFDRAARAFNEDRLDDWVTATEQLHQLRPHNQDFMRHLVIGYARQNRLSEAFNTMLMMQQQGLAEDWSAFEELEPLRQQQALGPPQRWPVLPGWRVWRLPGVGQRPERQGLRGWPVLCSPLRGVPWAFSPPPGVWLGQRKGWQRLRS